MANIFDYDQKIHESIRKDLDELLDLAETITSDLEKFQSSSIMTILQFVFFIFASVIGVFITPISAVFESPLGRSLYNTDQPYLLGLILILMLNLFALIWTISRYTRIRHKIRIDASNLNDLVSIASQLLSQFRDRGNTLEYAVFRMRIRRLSFSGGNLIHLSPRIANDDRTFIDELTEIERLERD